MSTVPGTRYSLAHAGNSGVNGVSGTYIGDAEGILGFEIHFNTILLLAGFYGLGHKNGVIARLGHISFLKCFQAYILTQFYPARSLKGTFLPRERNR